MLPTFISQTFNSFIHSHCVACITCTLSCHPRVYKPVHPPTCFMLPTPPAHFSLFS